MNKEASKIRPGDDLHWLTWKLRGNNPRLVGYILAKHGISAPPTNILGLARSMGIQLHFADVSGVQVYVDGMDAAIYVNEQLFEQDRHSCRLAIARELSRLLVDDPGESERMALGLLMPTMTFYQEAMRLEGDLEKLAKMFNVSVEMARKQLNLLTSRGRSV